MRATLPKVRPVVVETKAADPCAQCGARERSVCHVIDERDLARLAATAFSFELQRGQSFIREGDKATDFFNITGGTAKLFKMLPDGRQQITGFASAGHFLGLAVWDTYGFSAEAIEPLRLCRFSRPKLHALLHDFPALEHKLLETACNELATAQEQMLLLGRKTAKERVASFLLSRIREAPPCCTAEIRLRLPMTRGEIADYLGLTIETVSRTFSRFKAENFISIDLPDQITVLNQAWLQEVAGGEAVAPL